MKAYVTGIELKVLGSRMVKGQTGPLQVPGVTRTLVRLLGEDCREYTSLHGQGVPFGAPDESLLKTVQPGDQTTLEGWRVLDDGFSAARRASLFLIEPLGQHEWTDVEGHVVGWGVTLEQHKGRFFATPYVAVQYEEVTLDSGATKVKVVHARIAGMYEEWQLVTPTTWLFRTPEGAPGVVPAWVEQAQELLPASTPVRVVQHGRVARIPVEILKEQRPVNANRPETQPTA